MRDHLSDGEIAGFRRKDLTPDDMAVVDDHLAGCELCRDRLLEGARLERAGLPDDLTHLSYQQIAGFVDHDLDEVDDEIVRSHVELCRQCADEIRDLEQFRTGFNRSPIPQPLPEDHDSRHEWGHGGLRKWLLYGMPVAAVAAVLVAVLVLPREPVLVALRDGGGSVTLLASGKVGGIGRAPGGFQALVRAALESQQVPVPGELSTLSAEGGVLRGNGSDETFPLLTPIGTMVESARPRFRWGAVPGGEFYVVQVYTAGASMVGSSPHLTQPEWTPESPLPRGVRLAWQVRARTPGREILAPPPNGPEARFEILPESRAGELAVLRKQLDGFHLLLGLAYSQAGVLDEAEREFRELAQANPASPQAQRLLEKTRALRGTKLQ